jgi:formiminoglutamase
MFTPPAVPLPNTAPDDPRLGHLLGQAGAENARVVIAGFPTDEGVRINGGRTGAVLAPDRIRQWLYRLTPDAHAPEAFADLLAHTVDLGNLVLDGPLEADQARLGKALAPWLHRGVTVLILGGGHETACGHFLGYVEAGLDVSIFNLDAHADVRPLKDGRAHSGSPFFQALTHPSGRCRHYTVAGLQPHSLAAAHRAFLHDHGCRYALRDECTPTHLHALLAAAERRCMVTLDLDALDQAHAPGVSAPTTDGLDLATWLDFAEAAGRRPHFTSLDVVELCPPLDRDDQTARVAALTLWRFLKGHTAR